MSDKSSEKSKRVILDGQIKNSTFGRIKDQPTIVRPDPPKAQLKLEEKK